MQATRRGWSIERKLPIAVTLLLAALLALYIWAAYREVDQTATDAAGQRLNSVGEQLADLVTANAVTRNATMFRLLSSPSIDAALKGDVTPQADSILGRLRTSADRTQPVLLLDPSQRTVHAIGTAPSAAALQELPRVVGDAMEMDTMSATGRFFQDSSRAYSWQAFPIRRKGALLGYAAQLRAVGTPGPTTTTLNRLIGQQTTVIFTNSASPRGPWVRLDGALVEPPEETDAPFGTHRHMRGGKEYIAHVVAIPQTPWAIVTETPYAITHARAIEFLRRTGLVAAAVILAGAIIAWLMSRRFTRPMRELAAAAEEIGAGRYDRRVESTRTDELGALAHAFNRMALQVQTGMRETEESRAEAEQANRAKSEFLANMSHEIRTPINAMLGYADLLQLGISGPVTEPQQSQLDRIKTSGQHLVRLIDDLLDFARLESAQLSVEHSESAAADAVQTALTVIEPLSREKPITVDVRCGTGVRYIGDPQRVGQILVNLLSNAIKFSSPGGRVTLECKTLYDRAAPRVEFAVTDTGAGIEPERLDTIFDPFVQGHTGYTRLHGGSGLGLTISKRLAEMMDGEITVESVYGKGSRFSLILPAPTA